MAPCGQTNRNIQHRISLKLALVFIQSWYGSESLATTLCVSCCRTRWNLDQAFQHSGLLSFFLQNREVLQEVFAKCCNNENFKNTQLFCKTLLTKTPLRSAPCRLHSGCATISAFNRDIMQPNISSMPLSPHGSPAWTLFLSGGAACSNPCFSPFIWVPETACRG